MRVRVVLLVVAAGAGTPGCRAVFGIDDTVAVGTDGGDDTSGLDADTTDASPACLDSMLSPGETDVDCGGVCPRPCAVGDTCVAHTDCTNRVCDGDTCTLEASCLGILGAGQTTSGVYSIDVDGPGAIAPFDVYCEQAAEGGGWTLIMTLSSTDAMLAYGAPYWETTATLDDQNLVPNTAPLGRSAKLAAYNLVVGTKLRLEWRDPADQSFGYDIPDPTGSTALAVFQSGEDLVDGNEGNSCHGALLTGAPGYAPGYMRHATGPQFFGVNGEDGADDRLRFGFGSNDEPTNAWAPRQAAGPQGSSLVWTGQNDCNNCACYGQLYEPVVTSANLWIR